MVKKYDGEFPNRFLNEILNYLSLDKEKFPKASKNFEQPIMNLKYFNMLAESLGHRIFGNLKKINGNSEKNMELKNNKILKKDYLTKNYFNNGWVKIEKFFTKKEVSYIKKD